MRETNRLKKGITNRYKKTYSKNIFKKPIKKTEGAIKNGETNRVG